MLKLMKNQVSIVLTVLFVAIVGCGKQPAPFVPSWEDIPGDNTLKPRPPTSELNLRYSTVIAGVQTECLVPRTVDSDDIGVVYQRLTDEGVQATFSRLAGHPYPEFVFEIRVTDGSIPSEAVDGACDWNLPEAL